MPLFYSGQSDYISKLNLVGNDKVPAVTLTAISATGSQTRNLDLALANVFYVNISAAGIVNLTLTLSNVPASTPNSVLVYISTTSTFAHTLVATATVKTLAGQSPPVTNGTTSIFRLNTYNGTTWYVETIGQAYTT